MILHIENCPFCGSENVKPYEHITEPTDSYCQCADCGTIGPSGKEPSKESAIAAWNLRAALQAQQGEAKDVRQDGGDAAHQEPVPEGWQVTHMPPWDALTDEAQEQQRICVQRLVAPFCDATGLRVWSGPTLEAAMQSAHAALKLPYKASAAPAVAQGAKDAPAPADWREHAALACYGERVAADETKSPEDAAYNQAIENCMDAIRNLDDVAQCSTKPAPATLAVDLDALDIAYKHHTGHEVKKAVWLEDVRALLAAAGSSQWQDDQSPACKGPNCGATDGRTHSVECQATHTAACAGGYFVKQDVLNEIIGCFHAAEIEGLSQALSETNDEHLKDLIERRLMYALYAARAAKEAK